MRTKLMRSKSLLLFMTFGILLAIPAIAFAQDLTGSTSPAPTIQSDKADYAPGELATLTGSGWQAGESVHINVNDDAGQTWSRNVDVTADASGNISDSFNLPDWFVATYQVTATGAQSGGVATTSFTDGNVAVRARAGSTALGVQFPAGSVKRYDNKTCTDPSAQSNAGFNTIANSNTYTNSGVTADNTQSVSVTAPSPVTISETPYNFSNWTADSPSELTLVSSTGTTSCITRGPSSINNPVWNITANYTDTTAPQVVSINRTVSSPTNDPQVQWRVTFSENVTGVSTGDFSPVNTGLGGTLAITSGGSGAVWIVTASTGSGDGTLGLKLVDDDTIVDGSTNTLGGTGTGNGDFTTGEGDVYTIDRTAPTVTAVVPTENANNVDIGTNVSATFSEDMGTSVVFSGLTFTLKLPNGNTVLAGRTHNAATNTATLNPTSNLANSTTYTATVTTTARDLAGNPLATAKAWSFTTAAACTAPSVTTQPGPQSITYGANASFTAAASGTSPNVQWQVSPDGTNWTNVSGATSTTLTLTKPLFSQNGNQYRAVFTNSCGNATSNPATLQVAQKNLTISGAVANNKPYDATTNATVNFSGASLVGMESGDSVTINSSGYSANFDNKNVGNNKAVTVTGVTLGGTGAGNYTVSQPSGLTANITSKQLTGSFTAENKTYDGNTSATVDTGSLPGVIGTDEVNLDVTNAQFDTASVADGKTVSADLALSGAQAGNYSLSSNTATTTANITAKELTGSFTAENKVYDGNTDATIIGRSVAGKVGSDDVSLDGGTAHFDNKNVGNGKTVTGTGFTLAGAAKDNYTLKAGPWTTTVDINPATLTVTAANQSKKLGDPNPTFTASYSGFVNGEDTSVLGGTLNFATNVPNPEQVGTWDIIPSGLTSSNYNINFVKSTLTITSITYKFDGFRPPVDNPGAGATPIFNSAKAGQSIPVKFGLGGNQGLDIIAAGYPKVTSVNCSSSATVDPLEAYAASTANGGLNYDATANQYNYVWKTQSTYANKCFKFDMVLKDGTSHVAYFKFLK